MIDLRLRRLTIFTAIEQRAISFTDGINVISGPYGSGKSSLLELIKYALGGSGNLSEAVEENVTAVVLEALMADRAFSFERNIGELRTRVSQSGERIADLHATSSSAAGSVLASDFLLEALDVPAMRVRRSQDAGSNATESISFWDLYRYIYVSQDDMGQSIAGHTDSQLNRHRKRAFDLMFGLVDAVAAELETEEGQVASRATVERKRLDDVTAFLDAAGVPTRAEALSRQEAADRRRADAVQRMIELRTNSRKSQNDLQSDQDSIGTLYGRVKRIEEALATIQDEIAVRKSAISRLHSDVASAERSQVAFGLLGQIDFTQCPRCLQPVSPDRVEAGHCYLCTQTVEVGSDAGSDSDYIEREKSRIRAALEETQGLLRDDEIAERSLASERVTLRRELEAAEARLRAKTDLYVAPLFDEIESLATEVARIDGEQANLELALRQWNERSAIQQEYDGLEQQLRRIRASLAEERSKLEVRRSYVTEFSETFDEIVAALDLAWYESARVDVKSYLPVINKSSFKQLSGGQRTVVSIGYHLGLLTLGLVHPTNLNLPCLLILDTPSKYLGQRDTLQVERNYRRIDSIVNGYERSKQVILADNRLPPPEVIVSNLITLSYDEPLVPGVIHPGPDGVTPIHEHYDEP